MHPRWEYHRSEAVLLSRIRWRDAHFQHCWHLPPWLLHLCLSPVCQSVHPSSYPRTHSPIHHPASHPAIHPSTHPFVHPSIHRPSIHPLVHPSTHHFFLLSIMCLSFCPSTYHLSSVISLLSVYLSLPLSIHQLPPPFSSYAKCITLQLLHPTLNRHTLFHSADTFNHTLLTDTWLLHVFLLQR